MLESLSASICPHNSPNSGLRVLEENHLTKGAIPEEGMFTISIVA
jgi:hypothetical protein